MPIVIKVHLLIICRLSEWSLIAIALLTEFGNQTSQKVQIRQENAVFFDFKCKISEIKTSLESFIKSLVKYFKSLPR